jgi:hypothetical protein
MGKIRLKETKLQKNKENVLKKTHYHTPAVYIIIFDSIVAKTF